MRRWLLRRNVIAAIEVVIGCLAAIGGSVTAIVFMNSFAPQVKQPVARICAMPIHQKDGSYLYYNGDDRATDDETSTPCREQDFILVASPSSGQVFFVCDRPENGWKCELKFDSGQDYRLTVGNLNFSIERPVP